MRLNGVCFLSVGLYRVRLLFDILFEPLKGKEQCCLSVNSSNRFVVRCLASES